MQAWLRAALDYIPQWLDYQMLQSEQPGCVIAIAHKGRIVLERAFGYADAVTREKLTTRHRFRAASHSKSFTATAILKLREKNLIRLDDPVGSYVQGLYPDIAQITVSQLLSHGAGLTRDGSDTGHWQDRRSFPSEQELRQALAEPAVLEAGMRLKYSNLGYGLAGLIIESVTGEGFATWMNREIIAAAGLRNTHVDAPVPGRKPFAKGHSGKVLLGRRLVVPADNATAALAPAAGIISTAADLARFFAGLDPDATASILARSSRREMIRRQWHDAHAAAETHYGLGVMIGKAGDWEWFGHSGGFQGCASRTIVLSGREISVSLLTNAVDGAASAWSDGIAQILRNFSTRGAASENTRGWTGRWWGLWGAIDLIPAKDHVAIAVPAMANPFSSASEIKVAGDDVGWINLASGFGSRDEGVRLVRGRTGRVREVWIAGTKLLPKRRAAAELKKKYES